MTSYVDRVLIADERVLHRASISLWPYAGWIVLGIVTLIIVIGLLILGWVWTKTRATEIAITNKRVIAKFGFIRRETVELRHSKVESLHVNQSIVGRIFNYGSVVITGSGGTNAPIPYISDPLNFRSAALTGMEAISNEPSAAHDPE